MSEITNVSRFRRVRDPAGSVEEKVQRLWLPIVRRTVHWFAGREQRPPSEFRSGQRKESQNLELLELERREIIGYILCLNPNYKGPADFKPLLKETKVPIPVKAYQGYNLIGLLLGPESNTQKRLEERMDHTRREQDNCTISINRRRRCSSPPTAIPSRVFEESYLEPALIHHL